MCPFLTTVLLSQLRHLIIPQCKSLLAWHYQDADKLDVLCAKHGPDVFYIEGGVSDAHDEAFFCWLLRAYDHVRSRLFSTDFSGSYDAQFGDEPFEDIGVDFDLIDWDKHTAVSSVTLECIGLRLAREGKLRALEAGDSYEFILPDAPPLKVWAVLASSQENALEVLAAYEPARITERDRYGTTFESPTGRLE